MDGSGWVVLLAVLAAGGCASDVERGADADAPQPEAQQPEGEANQPEGEANQPEDEANQPEGEANQPEDEANQPEDEANQPEDGVGTGPELVEAEDLTSAALPSLAMNGAGTALAVWVQGDGVQEEVWSNQHTHDGGWGTAQVIGGPKGAWSTGPQVAIDSAGNGLAVWDMRDDTSTDVWVTRSTPGDGWGPVERIDDDHAGIAGSPRLAMDASGHALVSWWVSGAGLWAKRFDPSGGWAAAELIDGSENGVGAHAAVNGEGDAVIVYAIQAGAAAAPSGTTLLGKRYQVGTGWTEASVIETTVVEGVESPGLVSSPSLSSPQVALTPDGTALAVWLYIGHPGSDLMFASSTNEGGWSSLSGPPNPAAQAPEGGQEPQLFSSRGGEVIVGWTPQPFFNALGGVLSSRYHSSTGWGQVEYLQGNGSDSPRSPNIAGNAAGDWVAVWSRGDGVQNTVWMNRCEPSSGWGTSRSIATSSPHDPMPRTAVDDAGNALVVWVQGDETRRDLVSQAFPEH